MYRQAMQLFSLGLALIVTLSSVVYFYNNYWLPPARSTEFSFNITHKFPYNYSTATPSFADNSGAALNNFLSQSVGCGLLFDELHMQYPMHYFPLDRQFVFNQVDTIPADKSSKLHPLVKLPYPPLP